MAIDSQVSFLTAALRMEFNRAYNATAKPAPYERFTLQIPSTAKIEHYVWMTPVPGIAEFAGHRRFGQVASTKYSVENKDWDSSFTIPRTTLDDDQTGGFMLKPRELAMFARKFPGRRVLKKLSLGKVDLGFDGTAMFANSHAIGTGDNLLAFDGASNDGLAHNLVALHHGGELKPLIWQNRQGPDFETDGGTPQSKEAKLIKYWIDLRGEAAYGYWWDAVYVDITDTPSVIEMHAIIAAIEAAFRTFRLPQAISEQDGEYIHEQETFSTDNLTLVGSTGLADVLRHALGESWAPTTNLPATGAVAATNRFVGFANWMVSAYLNE